MSYEVCNFYGVCHVITNFNKRFIILLCNICMLHLYAVFMEFVMSLQTLINALLIFVCYICMQFS